LKWGVASADKILCGTGGTSKFYFSLREGCLCNYSICPSICPLACPPTLPVASQPLAQFLVNFGSGAVFSSSVADIQVLRKQTDGLGRDWARNGGTPICVPVVSL